MSKEKIFREDALRFQMNRWSGRALLLPGIPVWISLTFAMTFILMLIIFITCFEYTRRISVPGEIITTPHSINVYSSNQGYVTKAYVKVGDRVKKGEVLYEINSAHLTTTGSVGSATKKSVENQINNVLSIIDNIKKNKTITLDNLNKQKKEYIQALNDVQALLESAKMGMSQLSKNAKEYEKYQRQGMVTRDQLTNQRYMLYQQQSLYQSLSSQRKQTLLQLEQVRTEIVTKSADFDNKISENEYQLSELNRKLIESEAGDMTLIKAQSDGIVQSMAVTPGQMVKNGSTLLQILPTGNIEYYFVLWVPDSAMPYLRIDGGINISYSAFPSDKFGMFKGTIKQISYTPATREELSEYGSGESTGGANQYGSGNYYKVMAAIKETSISDKGKQLSMSNGLRGDALVFLETKPLYKWMFSPVYNIKNSVVGNG